MSGFFKGKPNLASLLGGQKTAAGTVQGTGAVAPPPEQAAIPSTASTPYGGKGGNPFMDPDDVVNRGSITKVVIRCGDEINNIRLFYGSDGVGAEHGGNGGKEETWPVPDGEKIIRIEGRADGKVNQLQFFTDGGKSSPVFGGNGGTPFAFAAPDDGPLRTISGRSGSELDQVIFHFGLPCYIDDIVYDPNTPSSAIDSSPQQVAFQEVINNTSLTQSVNYTKSVTVTAEKEFDFTASESLGITTSIEATLPGVKTSFSTSVTISFKQGKSSVDDNIEELDWSVPVSVEPGRTVSVTSTATRSSINMPFSYTVYWYQDSQQNVVAKRTYSGSFKGVTFTDLAHTFEDKPIDTAAASAATAPAKTTVITTAPPSKAVAANTRLVKTTTIANAAGAGRPST